jgi:hypothetical protein
MNLVAALPLTGAEKKIAPASRTMLFGVETYITREFGTLKTPAAINSFWGSLRDYSTRNYAHASGTPATAVAATRTTTKTKAAAKAPARKAKSAGS